jgi:hypothetical protein
MNLNLHNVTKVITSKRSFKTFDAYILDIDTYCSISGETSTVSITLMSEFTDSMLTDFNPSFETEVEEQ